MKEEAISCRRGEGQGIYMVVLRELQLPLAEVLLVPHFSCDANMQQAFGVNCIKRSSVDFFTFQILISE